MRDGFILGLSDDITRQWNLLKGDKNGRPMKDKSLESEVDTIEGEGSEYDKDDFESELKNKKQQRKENKNSSNKKKRKSCPQLYCPCPEIKRWQQKLLRN